MTPLFIDFAFMTAVRCCQELDLSNFCVNAALGCQFIKFIVATK